MPLVLEDDEEDGNLLLLEEEYLELEREFDEDRYMLLDEVLELELAEVPEPEDLDVLLDREVLDLEVRVYLVAWDRPITVTR